MSSYESISEVLDQASKLLTGERAREYGDPVDSHSVIAKFWSTYLGTNVSAQDVAVMMTLLKIARLKSDPHGRDSSVDALAYLAIVRACQDKEVGE